MGYAPTDQTEPHSLDDQPLEDEDPSALILGVTVPSRTVPSQSAAAWSRSASPKAARPRYQRYERIHPWRLVQWVAMATVGGSVMLGLLLALGLWRAGDRFWAGMQMMLTPSVTEPEADVRTVVVQQLRGASELTTAIFTMEAVVPARSDRTLGNHVIGSTNLLYIAHGEVRAGVDLSQLSADQVQLAGDSQIRVILPPPQILDSKLDLAKSTVYDYDRGWLGLGPDNAPELQTLAQREALSKIEAAACDENLLAEANHRAERVVSQLLSTAGFQSVIVTTQPPLATCADLANSDTVIPGRP